MFRTRFRKRISHTLWWPVSAKELSDALADAPQADKLTIEFSAYERMDDGGKPRSILS
jgi:hypothetical protein